MERRGESTGELQDLLLTEHLGCLRTESRAKAAVVGSGEGRALFCSLRGLGDGSIDQEGRGVWREACT